jgi:hypothetical protein
MQQGRNNKKKGTLQHCPIPHAIWTDISMDFLIGLPRYGNKSIIMVVVDLISKYVHFCALQHPFKASIVAQFSWTISSNYMEFPNLLSPTVIEFSQANSRKYYSCSREPLYISTLPIIPRLMVKPKLSTSSWKHICGASRLNDILNGFNGYHSLNGGRIQLTMVPLV